METVPPAQQDYEYPPATSEAVIRLATIQLLVRQLATS
jgi:hypothetical protein